jgi:hypothetical protein
LPLADNQLVVDAYLTGKSVFNSLKEMGFTLHILMEGNDKLYPAVPFQDQQNSSGQMMDIPDASTL